MDFHGFGRLWGENVGHPVIPCAALCRPVPPCRARLDPPNIEISDSGGLDLEGWCLDAWVLAGLEGIGGGDGGDGGMGGWDPRTSHTLELQELGGLVAVYALVSVCTYIIAPSDAMLYICDLVGCPYGFYHDSLL